MSFKLIAIRPLTGCNKKFLKNLQESCIYKLYNNYQFFDEAGKNVERSSKANSFIGLIRVDATKEIDLYSFSTGKRKLNINVSAIAGKNGSGKSSVVELIYVLFYKLSRIAKIIPDDTSQNQEYQFNISEEKRLGDMFKAITKMLKVKKEELAPKDVGTLDDWHNRLWQQLESHVQKRRNKTDYDEDLENLKLEVVYETNGRLYLLQFEDDFPLLIEFHRNGDDFVSGDPVPINSNEAFKKNAGSLFYNLVINYSLYGLNAGESGNWIERLFHKNDSYQTPIVLNPFRDNGVIDINSENYLVRSRLLAILFSPDIKNKELLPGKKVQRIKLRFQDKTNVGDYIDLRIKFEEEIFPELRRKFFGKRDDNIKAYWVKTGNLYKKVSDYILRKIVLIPERYPTFNSFYDIKALDEKGIEAFVTQLYEDRSHITLKLRQALNFYEYQGYVNDDILTQEKTFPIKVLEKEISEYHKETYHADLIDFVPPSFFSIELYFDQTNEDHNFSNLSSGEKQKIYSLNSILYHFRNLISVNFNSRKEKLIVYKNYNLILDEIELYYHPELQRTFIRDLIEYLKKLDLDRLKDEELPSINICFITHSPFILSDIPEHRILFLDVENHKSVPVRREQTFAANIHEMLTSGFFMESTKGEIAIQQIAVFLRFYENVSNAVADKKSKEQFIKQISHYDALISLIGEDYIRETLNNHMDFIKQSLLPSQESDLDLEIKKLERRLGKLKKRKDEKD